MRPGKKKIKMFLISLGLVDSLYLLITSYLDFISELCPLNGCNYLIYNGINVPALFGFLWFLVYGFTGRFLKLWQIVGVLGIGTLVTIALYTRYFCPYCFAAYVIGIGLIIVDR